jgi:hypothetical protein
MAVVTVVAVASCARPQGSDQTPAAFDRAAYCEVMHTSGQYIDVEAMAEGDPGASETAGQTYEQLAQLAPMELAYEWRVIISGMDQMIRQARGEDAAEEEEAAEFRTAFQTVYSDYLDNCLATPSPTP